MAEFQIQADTNETAPVYKAYLLALVAAANKVVETTGDQRLASRFTLYLSGLGQDSECIADDLARGLNFDDDGIKAIIKEWRSVDDIHPGVRGKFTHSGVNTDELPAAYAAGLL